MLTGLLCLPIPLCCLPLRHHYCSGLLVHLPGHHQYPHSFHCLTLAKPPPPQHITSILAPPHSNLNATLPSITMTSLFSTVLHPKSFFFRPPHCDFSLILVFSHTSPATLTCSKSSLLLLNPFSLHPFSKFICFFYPASSPPPALYFVLVLSPFLLPSWFKRDLCCFERD